MEPPSVAIYFGLYFGKRWNLTVLSPGALNLQVSGIGDSAPGLINNDKREEGQHYAAMADFISRDCHCGRNGCQRS